MSDDLQELTIYWPKNLELCSISHQRAGWFCVLRCDDSWKDDVGQSLYAMGATGRGDSPQSAIYAAMAKMDRLVEEINREIPLRKENRKAPTASAEADELFALLGLGD